MKATLISLTFRKYKTLILGFQTTSGITSSSTTQSRSQKNNLINRRLRFQIWKKPLQKTSNSNAYQNKRISKVNHQNLSKLKKDNFWEVKYQPYRLIRLVLPKALSMSFSHQNRGTNPQDKHNHKKNSHQSTILARISTAAPKTQVWLKASKRTQ